MSDVYILGTDMIKFGRFPDKSVAELGAEAAQLALDDAGVAIQDIEGLWCGTSCMLRAWSASRSSSRSARPGSPS